MGGSGSLPLTSMVVPERVVSLVDLADDMTDGISASAANARSSPTAVMTEPSITPRGGTKNPPTIIATLTERQMMKVTLEKRFFFIVQVVEDHRQLGFLPT